MKIIISYSNSMLNTTAQNKEDTEAEKNEQCMQTMTQVHPLFLHFTETKCRQSIELLQHRRFNRGDGKVLKAHIDKMRSLCRQ